MFDITHYYRTRIEAESLDKAFEALKAMPVRELLAFPNTWESFPALITVETVEDGEYTAFESWHLDDEIAPSRR